MKHNNSTTYINYKDQSSSSNSSEVVFTSSKSDSLSTVIKNKTFVAGQDLYVKVNFPRKLASN